MVDSQQTDCLGRLLRVIVDDLARKRRTRDLEGRRDERRASAHSPIICETFDKRGDGCGKRRGVGGQFQSQWIADEGLSFVLDPGLMNGRVTGTRGQRGNGPLENVVIRDKGVAESEDVRIAEASWPDSRDQLVVPQRLSDVVVSTDSSDLFVPGKCVLKIINDSFETCICLLTVEDD